MLAGFDREPGSKGASFGSERPNFGEKQSLVNVYEKHIDRERRLREVNRILDQQAKGWGYLGALSSGLPKPSGLIVSVLALYVQNELQAMADEAEAAAEAAKEVAAATKEIADHFRDKGEKSDGEVANESAAADRLDKQQEAGIKHA